tara:strand:+ start:3572 stop:3775 length:204 start_codon:yes stop_codon:yes gene_type:complete
MIQKLIQKYAVTAGSNTIPAITKANRNTVDDPVKINRPGNGLKIVEIYAAGKEAITASLIFPAGSDK